MMDEAEDSSDTDFQQADTHAHAPTPTSPVHEYSEPREESEPAETAESEQCEGSSSERDHQRPPQTKAEDYFTAKKPKNIRQAWLCRFFRFATSKKYRSRDLPPLHLSYKETFEEVSPC